MKKIAIVLAILLIPAIAMAGMSAMSKKDLQTIKGQTGLTLIMANASATAGRVAWGDSDGFAGAGTAGWLVLTSLTLPGIHVGVNVDIGTGDPFATGSDKTYILIHPLAATPMLSGSLTVGGIYLNSTSAPGVAAQRLGELQVGTFAFYPGDIYITAH